MRIVLLYEPQVVHILVADEIKKSAIKVGSMHDRTTQRVFFIFSFFSFFVLARSLFFIHGNFVCAGVYAVASCYVLTNQPVTDMSNVNSSA